MISSSTNSAWTTKGSHKVFAPALVQSAQDDRAYRLIRLDNGLEALLISDPNTDKAAASLNVGTGHLSDPDDRPGLAHFCEHLLFMGTKQFPKENAYAEFISQHGGHTNAYTSTTNTNYHFSVSASALDGALERFSTFFHSPLFSPSCTARELNAVDSENKKNRQSDMWRIFQLDKSLSSPDSRWKKFGSGNWESLMGRERTADDKEKSNSPADAKSAAVDEDGGAEGREVRRRLLEWYDNHYSANRMTLAILGKDSLDDLAALTEKLFSPIPDRKLPALTNQTLDIAPPPTFRSPWDPAQEGTTIFAKTVMDYKALEVRWVVPWQTPLYKTKPTRFLSHFIGHEGYGSIYSVLKNKGWLASLSSSHSGGDRDNGYDFFRVVMVLTTEGWRNYASIVKTIHAYIDLLERSPLLPWMHDEIKTVAETAFRFTEKHSPDSYVTSLSEQLSKPYARTDILSGGHLVYDWDERGVRDVLKYLTPEKARVTLMGRDDWEMICTDNEVLNQEGGKEGWNKERWYGTEHLIRRTSSTDGVAIEDGLALPGPNSFIPKNFDIEKKEGVEPLKRPLKIRETSLSTLWYKKDDRFWVPKATFTLEIHSPLAGVTPRNAVMTRLFSELVTDALTERTYDAGLAGLHHSIHGHAEGLTISVSGYSDKLAVLLETILKEVKHLTVLPDRFKVQIEQLKQEWQNTELGQPYEQSDRKAGQILWERFWNAREKLNELEFITVEDVQRHVANLVSRTYTTALIHGNIRKDDALGIIRQVEQILDSRTLTATELISMRSLILPPGTNYVYEAPVTNKDDVNSGITYYCQVGDNTNRRLRATVQLLAQIAREPCFNQLRTKEQLGYIVSSSVWTLTGTMGFKITVQSERDPVYLETRVDAFLEQLKGLIEEMSEDDFEAEKKSVIDKKLEKIKNLREENNRFWHHIDNGYHDFRQREIDAETIKTIDRSEVLMFLKTHIHPDSPTRSKLSIHMCSQTAPSPRLSLAASAILLEHLKAAGIPVQEAPYNAAAAMQLSVAINQNVWTEFFKKDMPDFDKTVAADLVTLIAKLAKIHPVENAGEENVRLRKGTVFVEDMAKLKATLTLSKAANPVEIYSDLAGSKL